MEAEKPTKRLRKILLPIRSKLPSIAEIITKIKSQKFVKETFWSGGEKVIAALFFFGLNIFLARHLGVERWGTWSFFLSIVNTTIMVSFFGINSSSRTFIAQQNHTEHLKNVLKAALILRLSFSFVFSLSFLIIVSPLVTILNRPDIKNLLYLASPLIFLTGLVEFLKRAFEGLHRLKYAFFINFFEHALKLAFSLIVLTKINELFAIVHAHILAFLITSIIGLFFYRQFYRANITSHKSFTKKILKYSFPLFLITIGYAIITELDTFMLGILSSDVEVGIYTAGKQIITKLPHISFAISLGTMPVFAKLNSENKDQMKALFNKLLKTNGIIFGSISVIVFATAWFFMPLIYGDAYSASVVPMMILMLFAVFYSFSNFLSPFLDYQERAKKRARNFFLVLVINIILNLLLIPRLGATGAAIGTSVSYGPYVLLNLLEVRKVFREL